MLTDDTAQTGSYLTVSAPAGRRSEIRLSDDVARIDRRLSSSLRTGGQRASRLKTSAIVALDHPQELRILPLPGW
ncbi:hypothetical protein [Nocardia sp. NPDC051570]|uniref:hypothetical protein n=1 Tax=Nocardia sp. NPDC051570 TaxID=3364324 RepID=UPI0037A5871E